MVSDTRRLPTSISAPLVRVAEPRGVAVGHLEMMSKQKANDARDAEASTRQINPMAETALIVVAALVFAFLIQWLLVKPYKIPSESMVPTLTEGQRVLVNRVEGRFGSPERGDVVVFHPPPGADQQLCGIASGEVRTR